MDGLHRAVKAVRSRTGVEPGVTIALGAGMEPLADAIEVDAEVHYHELGDLPGARVVPAGRLIVGRLEGAPVAALHGAFHRHDAHDLASRAFLVRLLRLLGPEGGPPVLLLAGGCVSVSPLWREGELALVADHINLTGENPLVGPNLDALGPRFPDMSEAYDPALQARAMEAALEARVPLRRGIYAALAGPQPPTRAERRMLRRMGADLVGHWGVAEVIVARHMGMRVLCLLTVAEREGAAVAPEASAAGRTGVAAILARVASGAE